MAIRWAIAIRFAWAFSYTIFAAGVLLCVNTKCGMATCIYFYIAGRNWALVGSTIVCRNFISPFTTLLFDLLLMPKLIMDRLT